MKEELSKPVLVYLVLNFLCNIIHFLSKMLHVTFSVMWHVTFSIWFDFYVSVFLTIFLYLCVLEAIWVLFWTLKGIIWKFMLYFTIMIFNVTSGFFWWKWGIHGTYLELKSFSKKTPGMLYTIGFQILSSLWISNFHLPKMTWQVLIML